MSATALNLCFKGNRSYLHGTDLFNRMSEHGERFVGGPLTRLRFAVHRPMAHAVEAIFADEGELTGAQPGAVLAFHASGKRWQLVARETTVPVQCRNPYDEEQIVEACTFDEGAKAIRLTVALPFSDIELWVAANKALLDRWFGGATGWWFVRAEVDRYTNHTVYKEVTLSVVHSFNQRLIKSAVTIDSVIRGHIFFAARQA